MIRVLLLLIIILIPNSALCGINNDMKKFWDESGGVSNSSGPSSYQGQSAGYYTMGGVYARTPVKNTNIASIQLPSMKAGCGGIDLYNGGLSFISSDELVQAIKAISSNGGAFAAQLALETMSPVVSEKLEEFYSLAQRVNAMNINSCESAASLVGGMWPKHERASQTICSTLANSSGITSDYAKARHQCSNSRSSTRGKISSKNKEAFDKLAIEDINLAWKAINDAGFFNLEEENDKELAQLFMTLSGTIIIRSNGDTPHYKFISGRAAHNDIIRVLMEGGTIEFNKCDEFQKCLNVTDRGNKKVLKISEGFIGKVDKYVQSILEKIQDDEQLTKEEIRFLNYQSSLPLYKILNVYAAYSGAGPLFELRAYTEVIALQMLYEYLNDVMRQMETASDTLIIASDDHLKRYRDNLKQVRMALTDREIKSHNSHSSVLKLVDRARALEGLMANELGGALGDSYQWSKNM